MQILSGDFRRRRLESPKGSETTRPMPSRVRESIFSILRGHVQGQNILDCFAGSGSMGLEAISRGAERCVFVERDRGVAKVVQRNIDALGVGDRCDLVQGDALGSAALTRAPRPVHLLFFDPPYKLVTDPESRPRVFRQLSRLIQLLDDEGYAVFRTPWPLFEGMPTPPQHADEVDLLDEDLEWRDEEAPEPAFLNRTRVDLRIDDALGPETHAYNSMAVHFYMKDTGKR
ncbi:MAG: 16S rRNA (guanine(966)-N(2))-methyltransferase RsmD [Phycisphaeraceae bacterium]|nr:16S rRNA (guanine(966)-N(2))-methyltransferase RsmD [Phycisphaeraceae bacterium]MCB9848399.1 16S rRNA (guanine(966)-N(2))-methyltransferase RsmD [Phycisphaeraceae bacterium]